MAWRLLIRIISLCSSSTCKYNCRIYVLWSDLCYETASYCWFRELIVTACVLIVPNVVGYNTLDNISKDIVWQGKVGLIYQCLNNYSENAIFSSLNVNVKETCVIYEMIVYFE